jgi:GTP1/Obg family GTP-binding protein
MYNKYSRLTEIHRQQEAIDLQLDRRYRDVPIKILDTVVKRTRTSEVRVYRVQWSRHGVEEATWEREDALKKEFPHLFGN